MKIWSKNVLRKKNCFGLNSFLLKKSRSEVFWLEMLKLFVPEKNCCKKKWESQSKRRGLVKNM